MEHILEELCIHNIAMTSNHCTSLPEYRSHPNGDQQYFNVDPDACARTARVNVLATPASHLERGVLCQRQTLFHSLLAQRKRLYCVWRIDASSITTVQRSLADLTDALDQSGSVTSWGPDIVVDCVRSFCEQQRIRTRCVVLILDHATPAATAWFLDHACPAWGTVVYVIPTSTDASRVTELLRGKVPATESMAPLILRAANDEVPNLPDDDVAEIHSRRCSLHWIPYLATSVLNVDAATIDDSYLRKYFKACGCRPLLLRTLVEVMRRTCRDSYEAFHAVVKEQDHLLSPADIVDAHVQRLWTLLSDSSSAGSPLSATRFEDDLVALSVLPLCFPAYVLSDACVRLLESCGIISVERQRNRPQALAIVHMCSWVSESLVRVMTPEQQKRGCLRVLARLSELDALAANSGIGDCATFRLHDQLSLGGHRTSHSAAAKPANVHREVVTDNAFATPATSMTPRTARSYDASGTPESWLRHRDRVVPFVVDVIVRNRWFFPEFPDTPASIPFPPIRRPFEELVFGIPPLPEDEATWTTTLASLFLQYADCFRGKGDHLNAAAASERALCVYLHFVDIAATAATAKYAVHLSKGPDHEKESRRRSVPSMLGRRASSRHSADSGTEGELRSVQSGMMGQSFVRKMSRLTQMTQESSQNDVGPDSQQAYAHTFSMLLLGVESLYRRIAGDYAAANVTGIACPLLDRGIATLELLNMNRRDTPARAMTHFRRGQKELLLSRLEKRRGEVIQHAPEAQQDEGDLKLKALVKADVEERHHLRCASDQMKECLQVLRMNQAPKLLAGVIEECNAVIARHFLSEVSDKDAAESAQRAVETASMEDDAYDNRRRRSNTESATAEAIHWGRTNLAAFLHAITVNDYALANEMMDRSPYLACLVGVKGMLDQPLVVCAGCGDLTDDVLRMSFPEPTLSKQLHLFTNFSDAEIAGHHGNNWSKRHQEYQIPLLVLLLTMSRTDETLMAEGGILFRRFMESCSLNPLCCSPHDMKSALHIATDRSLGDVAQYLLQHPAVDPLVGAPFVLAVERVGLRTVPDVKQLQCPMPCPLMYACEATEDCTMLMTLLLGSKDPEFTFIATQYSIVERLAREQESFSLLNRLIGPSSVFSHHAQALLVSPKLCSETREAVGLQCTKESVLWGLTNVQDPNVLLGLCAVVGRWGSDGAARLLELILSLLGKRDWILASEIMRRFPTCCPEEKIPYELQRELKRWMATQDLSG